MGDEDEEPPLTTETTIAIKMIAPMIAKIVSMIFISTSPLSNNKTALSDCLNYNKVGINL